MEKNDRRDEHVNWFLTEGKNVMNNEPSIVWWGKSTGFLIDAGYWPLARELYILAQEVLMEG